MSDVVTTVAFWITGTGCRKNQKPEKEVQPQRCSGVPSVWGHSKSKVFRRKAQSTKEKKFEHHFGGHNLNQKRMLSNSDGWRCSSSLIRSRTKDEGNGAGQQLNTSFCVRQLSKDSLKGERAFSLHIIFSLGRRF